MYALVKNNEIKNVLSRPNWVDDNGDPVSDSFLVASGYYPVRDNPPDYNSDTEKLELNSRNGWIIQQDHVEKTYTVTEKTQSEIESDKQELKRNVLAELIENYQNDIQNTLQETYTSIERDGWRQQQESAQKYLDNGTETKLLQKLAERRGVTTDEMANSIKVKADQFEDIYGDLTGKLGSLRDQLDAASTFDEIRSVKWENE